MRQPKLTHEKCISSNVAKQTSTYYYRYEETSMHFFRNKIHTYNSILSLFGTITLPQFLQVINSEYLIFLLTSAPLFSIVLTIGW